MYFMRFLLFHFRRNIKFIRREQKKASILVSCNWWLYVSRLPDCQLKNQHFIHLSPLSLKHFLKSHFLWLKF